jgi:hypothetical protein
MKKQEVLDFMKWDELPKAAKSSNLKCPVLVERTSKMKDYAIANQGRIVADKKFKAGIARVIEYYPEKVASKADLEKAEKERADAAKKVIEDAKIAADKIIADKAAADKVIADKVIADKAKADKIAAEKLANIAPPRDKMIEFLVLKKHNLEVLDVKTNDDLFALYKKFKK